MRKILLNKFDAIVTGSESKSVYRYDDCPEKYFSTYTTNDYFRKKNDSFDLISVFINHRKYKQTEGVLGDLLQYVDANPHIFSYGSYTDDLGKLSGSNMSSFYFSIPWYLEDNEIEENFLQAIPLSANELKYLIANGIDSLENHFFEKKVNIFNFWRKDSMKRYK